MSFLLAHITTRGYSKGALLNDTKAITFQSPFYFLVISRKSKD